MAIDDACSIVIEVDFLSKAHDFLFALALSGGISLRSNPLLLARFFILRPSAFSGGFTPNSYVRTRPSPNGIDVTISHPLPSFKPSTSIVQLESRRLRAER